MVHPAVPNSDTLADASVTVCNSIHIDQGFSIIFGRGPHKLLRNSSRNWHLA